MQRTILPASLLGSIGIERHRRMICIRRWVRASFDTRTQSQETIRLEGELETEPEETLSNEAASRVSATDQSEIPVCHTAVWIVEIGMVDKVQCFPTELHFQRFPDWESAEQTEIEVSVSRPANSVEPRRAKARLAYWSVSCCVEIGRNEPMCSVDRDVRFDLVSDLRIPGCIERIAGSVDCKRRSRIT